MILAFMVPMGFGCAGEQERRIPNPPAITTAGALIPAMFERYQTLVVMDFIDASDAPRSGAFVAKMVRDGLQAMDFRVIELPEVRRLSHELESAKGDGVDTFAIHVGKRAGAQAVVVGRIREWKREYGDFSHLTSVSLGFRMVDVNSGSVLFSAQGAYPRPVQGGDPRRMVRALLANLLDQFGVAGGLLGTGIVGFGWELPMQGVEGAPVVMQVIDRLPASRAGLRVGDVILACNGISSTGWNTRRQGFKACAITPGQPLTLAVSRAGDLLQFSMTAVDRIQIMRELATDR